MSLIDASTIPDGTQLRADLCVVGSGAAGLAIAVELAGSTLAVLLVESGGLRAEAATDALAEFERSVLPPAPEEPRRARAFGGTTSVWYGRLARFDEIDFADRGWVPHGGWPVTHAELRYEARSARFFGLDDPDVLGGAAWRAPELATLRDADTLQAGIHVWPRRIDLGGRHLRALRAATNVRVLLHAHATRLCATPVGDAISSLTLRGADDRAVHVAARAYVLACGGWENPRLLLLSRDRDGYALGNRHDAVGRYYMNHPRNDGVARLFLARRQRQRRDLLRTLTEARATRRGVRRQLSFRVAERRQRDEQLLNAETFLYPVAAPRLRRVADAVRALPRDAQQRDLGSALRRIARIAAEAPLLARGALHLLVRRPFLIDHLALVDQGEQSPDPASRITLGERLDRFGDPLLRVAWAIGGDTTRSLRRLHELLGAFVTRSGIGRLESALFDPAYEPRYLDAAHPMGTTRMSVDPRRGVVDASCRVHAVANLWIAGSSTFPTGGHAAPTWTIVCLALRLADELRTTLARG